MPIAQFSHFLFGCFRIKRNFATIQEVEEKMREYKASKKHTGISIILLIQRSKKVVHRLWRKV